MTPAAGRAETTAMAEGAEVAERTEMSDVVVSKGRTDERVRLKLTEVSEIMEKTTAIREGTPSEMTSTTELTETREKTRMTKSKSHQNSLVWIAKFLYSMAIWTL